MSNLYSDLELAIVNRLSAAIAPEVEVEALPETSPEAEDRPFAKTRVTVAYTASEYSATVARGYPEIMSSGPAYQYEYAEVVVVVRARLLRGAGKLYETLKAVSDSLHGYAPPNGWNRMYLKISGYDDAQSRAGLWSWTMTFVTRRPYVQAFADDATVYPNLVEATANISAV